MKSFPALRPFSRFLATIAFGLLLGPGLSGRADSSAPASPPTPAAKTAPKDEDPPTTIVTPSDDSAEADAAAAKASADANRCTQCQIQSDAYRRLKAEADDASANIQKNKDLQAQLKPDEDKSAWIKVESNLRMWDIKLESLQKNLSALEAQMKQDCQGCPQIDALKK